MPEEKDSSSFDLEDFDHDFQRKIVEEGREIFKESNPGLHAVLEKYKNHNVESE